MIEERDQQSQFKPTWGPYRNAHFLVVKMKGMYHIFNSAVSFHQNTLGDAVIPPLIEELSEAFMQLPIASLSDFQSWCNHNVLLEDSWDNMTFQSTQGMYWQIGQVQGATNVVSAFVQVFWNVPHTLTGGIPTILINNVRVKGLKSQKGEDKVEGLPGDQRFIMEHLQNLENVLAGVLTAGATTSI